MDNKILLIYAWGDDNPNVIGIATDKERAIRLLTKKADKKVIEISTDKFRKSDSTADPSEYDYWIEEVKVNTLI